MSRRMRSLAPGQSVVTIRVVTQPRQKRAYWNLQVA